MKERKNHMKKLNTLVAIIIGLIVFFVIPAIADTYQHNYKQPCIVYEVTDTHTTFIDPVGYLWDVFDTDYKKGDEVIVYFHDNFTDFDREDDIIKKVKRVG